MQQIPSAAEDIWSDNPASQPLQQPQKIPDDIEDANVANLPEKVQSTAAVPPSSLFERFATSVATVVDAATKRDELDWGASFGVGESGPPPPPAKLSAVAGAAASFDDCWTCDAAAESGRGPEELTKTPAPEETIAGEDGEGGNDPEDPETCENVENEEEEIEAEPEAKQPQPQPPPPKREEEEWEKIVKKKLPPRLIGNIRDPLGPFTVIFFGDKDVGKTTIVSRYVDSGFGNRIRSGRPTVCADISTKTVILGDGDAVRLTLWDTAGAEQFKSFLPMYMRKLDAAILVYAANDARSMHAIGPWHEFVAREAPQCAVWFAVANKIDTVLDTKSCDQKNLDERLAAQLPMLKDGAELARIYDIPQFKMTNALTGEGVDDLFTQIAVTLRTRQQRLRGLDVKSVSPDTSARVLKKAARAITEMARPPPSAKIVNEGVIILRRSDYEDADRQKAEQKELARLVRREIARRSGVYSFC